MNFNDRRRQKFLDEAMFNDRITSLEASLSKYRLYANNEDTHEEAKSDLNWMIAVYSLELLLLEYTAGIQIEDLEKKLSNVIRNFDKFEIFNKSKPGEADALEVTQLEGYVLIIWLLTLCLMTNNNVLAPVVISWIDKNAIYNRGRDGLLESIIKKIIGYSIDPGRVLLHKDIYRPLARAVVADTPEAQSAYVKEFLEGWYKNMKTCYWHGTHSDGSNSYFGYWALEAALVTYLWDIDDSSYRDHLVYPKDLVDFAREHFPYKGPINPDEMGYRARCPGGLVCPRSGYWFTPAKSDSRQYFEQGQVLPEFSSDYGDTVWQWDENQA